MPTWGHSATRPSPLHCLLSRERRVNIFIVIKLGPLLQIAYNSNIRSNSNLLQQPKDVGLIQTGLREIPFGHSEDERPDAYFKPFIFDRLVSMNDQQVALKWVQSCSRCIV